MENNPFENGYGEIMDHSEEAELEYKPIEKVENKNKFQRDIIISKNLNLAKYYSYFPLDKENR